MNVDLLFMLGCGVALGYVAGAINTYRLCRKHPLR